MSEVEADDDTGSLSSEADEVVSLSLEAEEEEVSLSSKADDEVGLLLSEADEDDSLDLGSDEVDSLSSEADEVDSLPSEVEDEGSLLSEADEVGSLLSEAEADEEDVLNLEAEVRSLSSEADDVGSLDLEADELLSGEEGLGLSASSASPDLAEDFSPSVDSFSALGVGPADSVDSVAGNSELEVDEEDLPDVAISDEEALPEDASVADKSELLDVDVSLELSEDVGVALELAEDVDSLEDLFKEAISLTPSLTPEGNFSDFSSEPDEEVGSLEIVSVAVTTSGDSKEVTISVAVTVSVSISVSISLASVFSEESLLAEEDDVGLDANLVSVIV